MHRSLWTTAGALSAATGIALGQPQVWSGEDFEFVRAPFVDGADPANQDRITDLVAIARGPTRGIYNAVTELGYIATSPAGTAWASGRAADWQTLTFRPWVEWAGNNPPGTVGVQAVLHLIDEDIYLDITFRSWGMRAAGGGAFSYTRAFGPGCTRADLAEPFGELNFFDVSAFLQAFGAMDRAADLNNDMQFDFFDVSAYLALFGAGC